MNRYVTIIAKKYDDYDQQCELISQFLRARLVFCSKRLLSSDNIPSSSSSPPHHLSHYQCTDAFIKAMEEIHSRYSIAVGAEKNTTTTNNNTTIRVITNHDLPSVLELGGLRDKSAARSMVKGLIIDADNNKGISFESFLQSFATLIGTPAISYPWPAYDNSSVAHTDLSILSRSNNNNNNNNNNNIQGGVQAVIDWLFSCGYDINIEWNYYHHIEEAIQSQHSDRWPSSSDATIIHLFHQQGERTGESSLLNVTATQIRLKDIDNNLLSKLPNFSIPITLPALRLRFAFLRKFNSLLSSVLPLIDLRRSNDNYSMASLLKQVKLFIFTSVKISFFQIIMDATAEDAAKPPIVEVNRVALAQMKSKGLSIDFSKHSLFSTAWKQLESISSYKLRPPRPHGTDPFLAFEIIFKEEQVVGEAGPWRQFFTDCAKELQEGLGSPLLIKSPNGVSGIGDNREKYVLRPSSTSSPLLSLYQFLGVLMGESIRTGVRFPLDLPSFIWRQLTNEPLSRSDLLSIDKPAYDQLLMMECYDELTLSSLERTFITQLSDSTQVELKENGIETPVTIQNRSEYISLVLAARLSESAPQIDAIRSGLSKILPLQLFHLLTWSELEIFICGKSIIDIDLLKRHTVYSGGLSAESILIENFWKVLQEFDEYHRKLFIRFAWAQDRLLSDDAEFVRSHTRLMIKPASHPYPDQALPHSDTCFFNVSLPNYSSLPIMKNKLLYAITTCTSMNADEQPQDDQDGRGRRGRFGEDDDY